MKISKQKIILNALNSMIFIHHDLKALDNMIILDGKRKCIKYILSALIQSKLLTIFKYSYVDMSWYGQFQ